MMMASERQVLFLMVLSLLTFSFTINSSQASIAIYWGQNKNDGSLSSTCATGNYDIVLLSSLSIFGCGRTPQLNLTSCGDSAHPCYTLQPEIEECQQIGVKVFLSLGGATGDYSLCSEQDAKAVASFLFPKFLNGQLGPLGKVALNGIDFDIELQDKDLYWENLVKELDALRRKKKKFQLSAAPQCNIPDANLNTAIETGLFDYVFVHFYNNPACQFDSSTGDANLLLHSWDAWTSFVLLNNTVFMGLPAGIDAAPNGGYITPVELTSKVLPYIKPTPNYGGVMLWDRHLDVQEAFSDDIIDSVEINLVARRRRFTTPISEAISQCVAGALRRNLPAKQYSYHSANLVNPSFPCVLCNQCESSVHV